MIEYDGVNQTVLGAIPRDAGEVLDVGCGTGALGAALKLRQPARVTGVTFSEREAARATLVLDAVHVADLNGFDVTTLGTFDCMVCSHVLEHLHAPDRFLRAARPAVRGTLVVALPNPLVFRQRLEFLRGRFRYTDGWLMDRTHVRFFDWHTARELVADSGYRIEEARADGYLPLSRLLPPLRKSLDRAAVTRWPGLFGWQFVIVAH